MPKVSVLIPAYNAAKYIGDALASVNAQTLSDVETIVVDDGSSDDTREVVGQFPWARYVYQSNRGVAAARNRAASLASGTYLAFLDADDYWHPRKLIAQVSAFHEHPECRLAYTGATRDRAEFQALFSAAPSKTEIFVERRDLKTIFLNPYLGTPTVMVRRDAFERIGGYNEALRFGEDVDFHLRMLTQTDAVLFLPATLAYIRAVEGSLSRDHTAGYYALLGVYKTFLLQQPDVAEKIGSAAVRQAFYNLHVRLGRSLLWSRELKEARVELLRALHLQFRSEPLGLIMRTWVPRPLLMGTKRLIARAGSKSRADAASHLRPSPGDPET
jgi:glycosyltransferase involved in cell wall biosynthesis